MGSRRCTECFLGAMTERCQSCRRRASFEKRNSGESGARMKPRLSDAAAAKRSQGTSIEERGENLRNDAAKQHTGSGLCRFHRAKELATAAKITRKLWDSRKNEQNSATKVKLRREKGSGAAAESRRGDRFCGASAARISNSRNQKPKNSETTQSQRNDAK